MSAHNWDSFDDNDIYSETHEIEVDQEIQEELGEELNEPPTPHDAQEQPAPHDMNSHRQTNLNEFFKGGRTHIAQSRRGKYHQKRRAPRNLMVGMWNPLSIVQTDRTSDISEVLKKLDIIGLIGTQSKISATFPEHRVETLPHHYALHFGTDPKAKLSNKSAGVSLLVGKRFSPASIRRILVPPKELRGRGAIVRIKQGSCDITLVLLYYPPPPQSTDEVHRYHLTCTQLTRWVISSFASMQCGSSTEILLTDANSPLGRGDSHTTTADMTHVGHHGTGDERLPATLLWEVMLSRQLYAVDTFHPCGPTYYSPSYATSNPDHIIIPLQLGCNVKKMELWHAATRQLQLIPASYLRDHVIMVLSLDQVVPQAPRKQQDHVKWDYKKLASATDQHDRTRHEFLLELGKTLRLYQADFDEAYKLDTPDVFWLGFNGITQEVAKNHFQKENPSSPYALLVKTQKQSRLKILSKIRGLKEQLHQLPTLDMHDMPDTLLQTHVETVTSLKSLKTIATSLQRHLKKKRMHIQQGKDQQHAAILDAWQARDLKDVHAVSRSLACNGMYKKNRVYAKHATATQSKQEWTDYLGGPGHQGGLSTTPCDYDIKLDSILTRNKQFAVDGPEWGDEQWFEHGADDIKKTISSFQHM